MVHGPVREVVCGPSLLDWSTDRGSVFSGHPLSVPSLPTFVVGQAGSYSSSSLLPSLALPLSVSFQGSLRCK